MTCEVIVSRVNVMGGKLGGREWVNVVGGRCRGGKCLGRYLSGQPLLLLFIR